MNHLLEIRKRNMIVVIEHFRSFLWSGERPGSRQRCACACESQSRFFFVYLFLYFCGRTGSLGIVHLLGNGKTMRRASGLSVILFTFLNMPNFGESNLPYLLEKAPPPIKRFPRLSAAYETKNIKERRPRISAAFITLTTMRRLIEALSWDLQRELVEEPN